MLRLLAFLAALAAADTAVAGCETLAGQGFLTGMSAAEKAALVGDQPFASGKFFRAVKGGTEITLFGTMHLPDARNAKEVERIGPELAASSALLVESSAEDMKAMLDRISRTPDMILLNDRPSLIELLSPEDWEMVAAAGREVGMPPFMLARMQPWFAMISLSAGICGHVTPADQDAGIDFRVMAKAAAQGIPVISLEDPIDAIGSLRKLPFDDALYMLVMTAKLRDLSDRSLATVLDGYFAGEVVAAEAASQQAFDDPRLSKAEGTRLRTLYNQFMSAVALDRNEAWMPHILAEAEGRHVFVAVGAAHLVGAKGLLDLLHRAGFTVTRLDG